MPVDEIFRTALSFHPDILEIDPNQVFRRMVSDSSYRLDEDLSPISAEVFAEKSTDLSVLIQNMEPFLYQYGPRTAESFRANLAQISDEPKASTFVFDVPSQGSLALQALMEEFDNTTEEPSPHRLRALLELLEDEKFEAETAALRTYLEGAGNQ